MVTRWTGAPSPREVSISTSSARPNVSSVSRSKVAVMAVAYVVHMLARYSGWAVRDFSGKVAVVTGAASGIGFGLATRFAEEGMRVVLADVEEPALAAAVDRLRQRDYDVVGVPTDVSNADSMHALAEQTLKLFGGGHG